MGLIATQKLFCCRVSCRHQSIEINKHFDQVMLERQIQMQNQMRERMAAMQVSLLQIWRQTILVNLSFC